MARSNIALWWLNNLCSATQTAVMMHCRIIFTWVGAPYLFKEISYYKKKSSSEIPEASQTHYNARFLGFGHQLVFGARFRFRGRFRAGFGPYSIRTLSPTEQLESKNGGYFFIGVSRVDFENEILKRKFLFPGRVLGGFWYTPDSRVACSATRTTRIRK